MHARWTPLYPVARHCHYYTHYSMHSDNSKKFHYMHVQAYTFEEYSGLYHMHYTIRDCVVLLPHVGNPKVFFVDHNIILYTFFNHKQSQLMTLNYISLVSSLENSHSSFCYSNCWYSFSSTADSFSKKLRNCKWFDAQTIYSHVHKFCIAL